MLCLLLGYEKATIKIHKTLKRKWLCLIKIFPEVVAGFIEDFERGLVEILL